MEDKRKKLWIGLIFVASYFIFTKSAINELLKPKNANCACLGDVLTYTCTAVGGGSTRWGGTAFDCIDTSDEIILRHSRYTTELGTFGGCNDGAIVGRSLGAIDNCYTSQLNFTIQNISSTVTVQCTHNSGSGPIPIGESAVAVVSDPYPPPSSIDLTVQLSNITFTWNPVTPYCSSVQYYITSNCGLCPQNFTYTTTTTCFYQQIPSMCIFSIQTQICGFVGNPSVLTLKLPDVPSVNLIPHYSNSSQALIKVTIIATNVTDDVLKTINYCISYFNSSSVVECSNTNCSSCIDGVVVKLYLMLHDQCQPVNVNISAINALGKGSPLQHIIAGCNQFVKVEYNNSEATISCIFQDHLDTTEKSCSIRYGQSIINLPNGAQANSTTESPGIVLLRLNPKPYSDENLIQRFCYIITATNSTYTIIVEDCLQFDNNDGNQQLYITIVVPIISIFFIAAVITVAVIVVYRFCNQSQARTDIERKIENADKDHKQTTLTQS